MNKPLLPHLDRRQFSAGLGGLVLSFSMLPKTFAQTPAAGARPAFVGSLAGNKMLDAWLRINKDGSATIFAGKVELGQGILTALRQIAAEELDLSFARVEMISGDTALTPDEAHTSGSQSLEFGGLAIRLTCAEARAMLLEAAAKKASVPVENLTVADGTISGPNGFKIGYGDLVADIDLKKEASAAVKPKPSSQHKIVGQSIPRVDIPAKVTGGAAYVQDIRLPGMLHGRVVRPPRYGAVLDSVDDSKAKAVAGVIAIVRDGSFLGVVAEREENAIKAREALVAGAKWSGGGDVPEQAKLYEALLAMPTQDTVVSEKKAEVPAGARVFESTYTKPYMAHASIGPSCCVAEIKDNKLTVWSHTQGVFPLRRDLAKAMKMDLAAVRCIHVEGSGCYGHNGADDVALDAALLSRGVGGRPVRLQWMRDDEFAWEPYGAAMVMRMKASLADGKIVDWQHDLWSNTHSMRPSSPDASTNNLLASWYLAEPIKIGPATNIPLPAGGGDRNAVPLYDFASQRITNHLIPAMPVRVSALRTLGAYSNVFALECFMDEMAQAAGADPVAFRLAHLKDERAKAVIEAAAKAANWKPGEKSETNRGRGIGFAKYKNLSAYCAVVMDVELDRASGKLRVAHVWAATDAGLIVNPDGLKNQIEGGIIQSISWSLHEEVKFSRDGITTRDWASYPILTMPEVPKIEHVLINRPNEKPLGSGEGSQGPAVAALVNAVANATGKRMRDLPLTSAKVKATLT